MGPASRKASRTSNHKTSDTLLARLLDLHPKKIDLSLGRMHRLLANLGHPEKHLPPVVHIAGTNGKGSTLAFLRAFLQAGGYRVNSYTSPHLEYFHERIDLGGSPIDEEYLSEILERCEAAGLRMTGQRRTVARVLEAASDHPDVEELHRRAADEDARISLATVYRTVKLFEDAGIIERHDFRDGRARYETVPDEHHDHLIDLKSGRVIEFRNEEIERLQEAIARKLGFRLVDHRLELYGVPLSPPDRE